MKRITLFIIALFAVLMAYGQDSEPDYLCFEVTEGTTIKFGYPSKLEYSFDKISWTTLTSSGVAADRDCKIFFRGDNPKGLNNGTYMHSFTITRPAKCSGNIMTLIDKTGQTLLIPRDDCFIKLFANCPITTAPKLPAIQLKGQCYREMFDGCSLLLTPPELPATQLASNCYTAMFRECTSLTTAPELPATKLENSCYESMFLGCTNLQKAPELPATTLACGCYRSMFSRCTSLTTTPLLPALQVGFNSYNGMFSGCTSLVKTAPILFTDSPYNDDVYVGGDLYSKTTFASMFRNCINLKYISVRFSQWRISKTYKCLTNTFPCDNKEYTYTPVSLNWVEGVSSTGIFVCPNDLQKKYGVTNIPSGWTVLSLDELSVYDIIIEESSVSFISIPDQWEIESGTSVSFSVADRSSEGLAATVIVQGTNPIETTQLGNDYTFAMPAEDVTISVSYSSTPINYTITTDDYSSAVAEASAGETVDVTFVNRDGYNLTSATYNGNPLTITNNNASFTMPAENVTIATTYTKIDYTITADQYSTPNKTTANVGDEITVTFANRDGYNLTSATYNGTALNISNNTATFTMPAANVTIATTYTKVDYTITADQYSTPNKTTANVGDEITVTFANRDGYSLTSATYNGTALNISNNTATFTMPAANVAIATTYTKVDYTITADQYSTPNKNKANVGDEITVTFANRDGYTLASATYNGTALTITNNSASFTMPAANVTIATTYTKVDYTITADQYSTPNKNKANVGDEITVTFANRDGYNLTSATYNGTALNVSNNTATFTMPAANVTIATTYTPIEYNITVGEYVTANKPKATINDQVSFTVADRTAAGYQLDKVLINNTEISGTSFNMADYLTDVTITAVYSKIGYTITSDAYSTPSKTKANVGDEITVTFSKRDGYNLTSATYNGTALTIVDYKSQFTMPDEDVEIKTVYTVEQQQITNPEIITDNNVEITLPENLTENTEVTFTVQQKPGFTAFVYVNGVLTNEYKFVFTGKVEIKVDYKELTVSNISAETESYCAGDEINLTFATNPYAVEYELTFSNEAQKEGFENIDFQPVASYEKQPASFKIPQSAKPGKYHAFIRVKDSKDSHSKQYAFDFEVLYPTDIIETKYSDLICVNNSKNEYIGYQWFKNNKEIKGADKQFYIDAPMLNGSYSVALILKNGEKIRTCNYIVNNPTLKKSLKPSVNVYPNPAKASAPIVVELSEMGDLTDAYILIYNQLGVQIDKITNLSPHNTLLLKKGFYHGVVICGSTKLTFKIIVNE